MFPDGPLEGVNGVFLVVGEEVGFVDALDSV